jgi:hypothetical protein
LEEKMNFDFDKEIRQERDDLDHILAEERRLADLLRTAREALHWRREALRILIRGKRELEAAAQGGTV